MTAATINLPESINHSALRAQTERIMRDHNDKPIAIMLIDDDPDCRMLIRDAIEECKVSNEIMEMPHGQAAMEKLTVLRDSGKEHLPGLIYLDIEMPGMDGIETLRQIKADAALRHIPVVMMTGVSDETQMRRAAEYGANSYTLKPANAEQFLRTVLASTNYWLAIHQYPEHHLPQQMCRR